MPTILALAGVGTPPSMDGRSFAHLLNPDHRLSGDGQVLLFFGAGAAGAGSTAGTAGAAGAACAAAGWVLLELLAVLAVLMQRVPRTPNQHASAWCFR